MAYDKHSVSGTIITPTLLEVHLVICINYVEPSNSIIMDGLKYLCASIVSVAFFIIEKIRIHWNQSKYLSVGKCISQGTGEYYPVIQNHVFNIFNMEINVQ